MKLGIEKKKKKKSGRVYIFRSFVDAKLSRDYASFICISQANTLNEYSAALNLGSFIPSPFQPVRFASFRATPLVRAIFFSARSSRRECSSEQEEEERNKKRRRKRRRKEGKKNKRSGPYILYP